MGDVTDRNEMLITYRHITNPLATSLFSIFVASRLALFCYVKMAFFLLEVKLSVVDMLWEHVVAWAFFFPQLLCQTAIPCAPGLQGPTAK